MQFNNIQNALFFRNVLYTSFSFFRFLFSSFLFFSFSFFLFLKTCFPLLKSLTNEKKRRKKGDTRISLGKRSNRGLLKPSSESTHSNFSRVIVSAGSIQTVALRRHRITLFESSKTLNLIALLAASDERMNGTQFARISRTLCL